MALREILRNRHLLWNHGGMVTSMNRLCSSTSILHEGIDDTKLSVSESGDEEGSLDDFKRKAEEFVAMGFTERQAAYLSPDPEKARLPRLTRKEAGSYGRPDLVAQYVKELQQGMALPAGASMYNLDKAMPEILDPKCSELDAMVDIKNMHPDMDVVDIARMVGLDIVDSDGSESGDRGQVMWTFRNVLVPLAAGEEHPVNSKVSCEFGVSSLQEQYGLSDAAVAYIVEICDSRYNPHTGMIRLVSDRFDSREENQKHIEEIIKNLVKEGMGAFPKKTKRKTATARKKHVHDNLVT